MLRNERDIPIYVAQMVGGEGGRQIHYDISPSGSGASPGGKQKLIRGGGSAITLKGTPLCPKLRHNNNLRHNIKMFWRMFRCYRVLFDILMLWRIFYVMVDFLT